MEDSHKSELILNEVAIYSVRRDPAPSFRPAFRNTHIPHTGSTHRIATKMEDISAHARLCPFPATQSMMAATLIQKLGRVHANRDGKSVLNPPILAVWIANST